MKKINKINHDPKGIFIENIRICEKDYRKLCNRRAKAVEREKSRHDRSTGDKSYAIK